MTRHHPLPAPIIAGDIACISLRSGGFAVVDVADLPLVSGFVWHHHRGAHTTYAASKQPDGRLLMHRVILGLTDASIPVDHRDLNGLNNRRSNLRISTKSVNGQNTPLRAGTKSGFKGVRWHNASSLWHAVITKDRRQHSLGYHKRAEDAARRYDAAAVELYGVDAMTNAKMGLLDD